MNKIKKGILSLTLITGATAPVIFTSYFNNTNTNVDAETSVEILNASATSTESVSVFMANTSGSWGTVTNLTFDFSEKTNPSNIQEITFNPLYLVTHSEVLREAIVTSDDNGLELTSGETYVIGLTYVTNGLTITSPITKEFVAKTVSPKLEEITTSDITQNSLSYNAKFDALDYIGGLEDIFETIEITIEEKSTGKTVYRSGDVKVSFVRVGETYQYVSNVSTGLTAETNYEITIIATPEPFLTGDPTPQTLIEDFRTDDYLEAPDLIFSTPVITQNPNDKYYHNVETSIQSISDPDDTINDGHLVSLTYSMTSLTDTSYSKEGTVAIDDTILFDDLIADTVYNLEIIDANYNDEIMNEPTLDPIEVETLKNKQPNSVPYTIEEIDSTKNSLNLNLKIKEDNGDGTLLEHMNISTIDYSIHKSKTDEDFDDAVFIEQQTKQIDDVDNEIQLSNLDYNRKYWIEINEINVEENTEEYTGSYSDAIGFDTLKGDPPNILDFSIDSYSDSNINTDLSLEKIEAIEEIEYKVENVDLNTSVTTTITDIEDEIHKQSFVNLDAKTNYLIHATIKSKEDYKDDGDSEIELPIKTDIYYGEISAVEASWNNSFIEVDYELQNIEFLNEIEIVLMNSSGVFTTYRTNNITEGINQNLFLVDSNDNYTVTIKLWGEIKSNNPGEIVNDFELHSYVENVGVN